MSDIERHSGNLIREALNRYHFTERRASGTVDGEFVVVGAFLDADGEPALNVFVDAERVEEDRIHNPETWLVEEYDQVHHLVRDFREWTDEYDLETTELEEVDG